jgi:HEAT repeat protein
MHIFTAWVLLAFLQPGPVPPPVPLLPPVTPAPTPPAADPIFDAPDEQVLKDNRIAVDGPGLLDFFRQRVVDESEKTRIKGLIRQMGDDDFEQRENATLQLSGMGMRIRLFLLPAQRDLDAEIAHRARECLKQIDESAEIQYTAAALRVLAKVKPDGAAAALLAYLPSAGDVSLAEEVRLALADLAVRDGKADPVLTRALTDASADKRGAAAFALCRARAADQTPAVRKLLDDADVTVRYRAGLALAAVREKDAVPALIGLLDQLPRPEASRVEEILYRIADDKAPPALASLDQTARRKYRDAWKAWWDDNGAKVDAARLEEAARTAGYTLVILLDQGRVLELDSANHTRLQIAQLEFPLDAQLLPGDHVLVAEHNGNRVTERNAKNEVVWERRIEGPLAAQRLSNGDTFIATRTQLLELKPNGDEAFSLERPNGEIIMKAQKLRNGNVAMISQLGVTRFVELDPKGKEIRSFNVDLRYSGGRIDVLANGNLLMPEAGENRVVELDSHGNVVWQVVMEQPIAAVRLANGNTLVTSMTEHRAVEVDRDGKEVWQYRQNTRVTRAFRR